jgi:hypothetical protein
LAKALRKQEDRRQVRRTLRAAERSRAAQQSLTFGNDFSHATLAESPEFSGILPMG